MIDAAASLCPAWDISESFTFLKESYPMMDRLMCRGVQRFFLEKDENKEVVMSFSIPEIDSEDAERIDNFFCFIGGAWIS